MRSFVRGILVCGLLVTALNARAAVSVGVDPNAPWQGYMNVFELPENGGGYVFGNGWGTADLNAGFSGGELVLTPNTSIARDVPKTDSFWWKPDGTGNKNMDANFYVEDSSALVGQEVTFSGNVLLSDLVSPYVATAFIKDFAPGYGSFTITTVPLGAGPFSLTLNTIAEPGRHVQYGFEMIGPNARLEDIARLGSVRIEAVEAAAIPEPSTLLLFATSSAGLLALRRNRKA